MLELTFDEVIKAIGATASGGSVVGPSLFPKVSTDTRKTQPQEAFFALRGDRFDGHEFLEEALKKGASTLVVSAPPQLDSQWGDRIVLKVADTTDALQRLARYVRLKWNRSLIAVTGSMGKTTTRVFAATLLAQRYNVLQSPSNFNNEIGVPLSLLELESTHDVAILELGMNHAGEIGLLGQICRPNAALITNVAPVHLEFFNSVEDIARAKEEVLDTLQAGSTFFFNMDDPRVYEIASRYAGSKASYGFAAEADFRITYYQFHSYQEMEFEIKTPERYFRASVPFVGKHHLHNIAGAVALAVAYDLSWQEITAGLGLLRILPNRGQIANTGEIAIWDESYNSNPRAAEHLLATVESLAWNGRIILVLGDMLELGETSPELHRELGEKASGLNPAWLITVGEHARETANGAASAGTPAARLQHFAEAEKVAEFLEEILQPNDLLVVKGSRGVHLDRVIRAVRRAKA